MARIVKVGYNVRVKDANGRVRFARVVTVVDQDNITYRIGHQTTNTFAATRATYSHGGLLFEQDSVPDKPYSLVATPADETCSIAFAMLNNGGAAITNYKYKIDAGSWTALSPADAATPVTIPGLTAETEYSVQLRGVNANGDGFASDAVVFTTTA